MKNNNFKNQDWYLSLIEDCESIVVEKEFEHRFALIEGYHQLGLRVLEIPLDNDINLEELIEEIAKTLKIRKQKIIYAVKFASLFPNLSDLPMGKNVNWNKIVNEYLKEETEEELPALPDKNKLSEIVKNNSDWLVDNTKQNKSGVNLFLPYERIENEIL